MRPPVRSTHPQAARKRDTYEVLEEVVIDVKKMITVKNTLRASGALASLVAVVATLGAATKWW